MNRIRVITMLLSLMLLALAACTTETGDVTETPPAATPPAEEEPTEPATEEPTAAVTPPAEEEPGDPTSELEGPVWSLVEYRGDGETMNTVISDTEVTAQFQDGTVSGTAGCNGYSGEYQLDGDSLTVGQLVSTLIACEEPAGVMDQEAAFMGLLQSAASFEINGGTLRLLDDSGQILLVFEELEETAAAPLEGPVWLLEEYRVPDGTMTSVLADTEPTAQFTAGAVSGSGGCNSYSGEYQLEGQSLMVSPLISTEVFCEGLMDQETAFLEQLQAAAAYEVAEDGRLQLLNENGEVTLIFSELPEAADAPLVGTNWVATSFYDGDAVSSAVAGSEVTLFFGTDGIATGSAGCNQYSAPYQLDSERVTFGLVNATRIACSEPLGVMEQETRYLALLNNVATYELEGNTLTLYDDMNQPLVAFTASQPETR